MFKSLSVYQCLRFGVSFLAYLCLRSILVLFEKAQTGEDEVPANAYALTVFDRAGAASVIKTA